MYSKYKQGKAFSYYHDGWIQKIDSHMDTENDLCYFRTKCLPSERVSSPPHEIWIACRLSNGEILSCYCTCTAGWVKYLFVSVESLLSVLCIHVHCSIHTDLACPSKEKQYFSWYVIASTVTSATLILLCDRSKGLIMKFALDPNFITHFIQIGIFLQSYTSHSIQVGLHILQRAVQRELHWWRVQLEEIYEEDCCQSC